jgi:hypothetical protein
MSHQDGTYIELFGKRLEGWPATASLIAIWLLPFVAGYLLGRYGH